MLLTLELKYRNARRERNGGRQATNIVVEGRAWSVFWLHSLRFAVFSFWKTCSCTTDSLLGDRDCHCHLNAMEIEETCVVLDHRGRHYGSSCPTYFACSVDSEVVSRDSNYADCCG